MRRAARKDTTQAEIVQTLKNHGYDVDIRNEDGKPDLVVRNPGWPDGLCVQFESKTPNRVDGSYVLTPSEAKRRKKQTEYCEKWRVHYIKSGAEALELLGPRVSA